MSRSIAVDWTVFTERLGIQRATQASLNGVKQKLPALRTDRIAPYLRQSITPITDRQSFTI